MGSSNIIDEIINEEFRNSGFIMRAAQRWALRAAYRGGFHDGKEGLSNANVTRPFPATEGYQKIYDRGYADGQNARNVINIKK